MFIQWYHTNVTNIHVLIAAFAYETTLANKCLLSKKHGRGMCRQRSDIGCVEARIWERLQNNSAVPKSTVASIINNYLSWAHCNCLHKRGDRAQQVTLTVLQTSCMTSALDPGFMARQKPRLCETHGFEFAKCLATIPSALSGGNQAQIITCPTPAIKHGGGSIVLWGDVFQRTG